MTAALQNNLPLSDEHLSLVDNQERQMARIYPLVEKSMAEIDQRIARLEKMRLRFREEVANPVLKRTFACDVVKSGFRRIPMEIHMLILTYCVPSIPLARDILLLCKISSIWRRAALGMPELWTDICLTFGGDKVLQSTPQPKKCLNLFATRSKDLSLSVHLMWYPTSQSHYDLEFNVESPEELQFYEFVNFVGTWPENNRIRYLHIRSPSSRHSLYSLEIPEDAFDQLEYLTLHDYHESYEYRYIHAPTHGDYDVSEVLYDNIVALFQAPKLTYLSFDRSILLTEDGPGPIPATHLHIGIMSPDDLVDVFEEQFISLKKGFFTLWCTAAGPTQTSVTDYTSLEELALDYQELGDEFDCFYPLRIFRFPNLRHLAIIMDKVQVRQNVGVIDRQELDALSASLPSLKELTWICAWGVPTQDIISVLDHFTDLETLKLRIASDNFLEIISFLTYSKGHQSWTSTKSLPNLSSLHIEVIETPGTEFPSSGIDALRKMVSSRRRDELSGRETGILKSVSFVTLDNIDLEPATETGYAFEILEDEGYLDITMNTSKVDILHSDPRQRGLIHWEGGYIP